MAANTNATYMERFAYDAFVFSMSKFKIRTELPPSNCKMNTYEHVDFIPVISRGFLAHQLEKRDIWVLKFQVEFHEKKLKRLKQVSELMEEMLEEMDRKAKRNAFGRVVTSLALMSELIQFLHSKSQRLYLNDLAKLWGNYFKRFEEEFVNYGGLKLFYSIHAQKPFQTLGKLTTDFIFRYCTVYNKLYVSEAFIKMSLRPDIIVAAMKTLTSKKKTGLSGLEEYLGESLTITSESSKEELLKKEISVPSLRSVGFGLRVLEKDVAVNRPLKKVFTKEAVASAIESAILSQTPSKPLDLNREKESTELSSPIVSSEEQSGDRADPRPPITGAVANQTESVLSRLGLPAEALEDPTELPVTPEEPRPSRGRQRSQTGLSRLEQKRLKHMQRKPDPKK